MFQYFSESCPYKLVWIGGMSYNKTIYMFDNGTTSGFDPRQPDFSQATFERVNWNYYYDNSKIYCLSQLWEYWHAVECDVELCGLCEKAPLK